MAKKNISTLSVMLSADPSGIVSGTAAGLKHLANFAGQTRNALDKATLGYSSKAATSMFGDIKGSIDGALSGLSISGALRDIEQADMATRSLGMSVTEYRKLMLLAGPATSEMAGAMAHFGQLAGEASIGLNASSRAIGRLESLSGGSLGGGSTGEMMENAIRLLAKIPDETQRASVAYQVLGSTAGQVLPEIMKGAEGVDRAAKVVKNFGLGVGEKDLAAIRQVNQTIREMEQLFKGIATQVTLAFAPIASELTKLFDPSNIDISWIKNTLIDAAHGMAKAGAVAVEVWSDTSLIKRAWEALGHLLDSIADRFASKVYKVLHDADFTGSMGFGLLSEGHANKAEGSANLGMAMFRKLGKDLEESESMKRVNGFFDKVRANTGGTQEGKKPGAAPAFLGQQQQAFAGMAGSAASPIEQFKDTLRQIKQFDKLGMFAGNAGLKDRMMANAFQGLKQGTSLSYNPVGAAMAGTNEEYSARIQHRLSMDRRSVEEQMKAAMLQQLEVQKEQARTTRELLEAVERGAMPIKIEGI